jgi:hypothetical protein
MVVRILPRLRPWRADHRDRGNLEQARADFEIEWRGFSARRTTADYQAWRDQRDWTAWKYGMWARGERFPLADGQ